jgi:hypothetical protein
VITELAADLSAIEVDGKPGSVGSFLAANLFDGFHTVGVAVANALYVLLATGQYGNCCGTRISRPVPSRSHCASRRRCC